MQTAATTPEMKRYLMVRLGDSGIGIDVMQVREIAAMQAMTAVPTTARATRGVINLHGRVVPVVDLRVKLGMDEAEATARTSLVVVHGHAEQDVALIVDEVVEVQRGEGDGTHAVLDLDEVLGGEGR